MRVLCLVGVILATSMFTSPVQIRLHPAVRSQPVPTDADDPAIWRNDADPTRSLVIATNKVAAPAGALVVYDLEGRILQTIEGLDRPNNVDVQQGVPWGAERLDLVVATERLKSQLRVWRVDTAARRLVEVGAVPVFAGETGQASMPMGIGLYLRPADGALFAVVSPKTAGPANYLAQYRLAPAPTRRAGSAMSTGVRGTLVRRFGTFSGMAAGAEGENEIEAVLVDDALGYVYYSDEHTAVRKYHADPAAPAASRELAAFAREGFTGQREGLGLYAVDDRTGFIVVTDQIDGGSTYRLFRREGEPGRPHDHSALVAELQTDSDATDGIDVTAAAMGPAFPAGLLVTMNSRPRDFLFFDWRPVQAALSSR
jgi:3-phytase